MSYPLDDILEWWEGIPKDNKPLFQTPSKIFGSRKIFVQEIPSRACFNYLMMIGFQCNHNGEVIMSVQDADNYVSFQHSLMEEQNV